MILSENVEIRSELYFFLLFLVHFLVVAVKDWYWQQDACAWAGHVKEISNDCQKPDEDSS